MATIIQVKRTTTANLPSTLEQGELAYLYDTSATDTDAGGNGGRLFIGDPTSNTNTPLKIGGQYYTDLLDHTHGTVTASAGVIVDSSKKVDEWNVDNIKIDGNALTSTDTNGNITITPNGTGKTVISNVYVGDTSTSLQEFVEDLTGGSITAGEGIDVTYDDGAGTTTISGEDATSSNKGIASFDATDFTVTSGAVTINDERVEDIVGALVSGGTGLTATYDDAGDGLSIALDNTAVTAGSYGSSTAIPTFTVDAQGRLTAAGTASISTSFDYAADSGTTDTVNGGETITFTGGEGIDTAVSNNTITITAEDATSSNKGVATFNTADFDVASGDVTIKSGGVSNTQLAGSITNAKLVNSSVTIGSDTVSLGGTQTDLNGITSLDVDNITVDGNVVSTTDTDGDLELSPNGTGTVIVPSGYESRAGFQSQSLVNKAYVDQVANGLDVKASVRVATTANLSATYNNSNGTLTATSNAAISIDGVSLSLNDRVLVKDQTDATENGFYKVTTVGSGSAAFVLTRTPDANEASEITGGAFTFVEEGTVNADSGYVLSTDGAITIDTTALVFTQFSGAGSVTAGAALTKTGNTLDVAVDDSTIEITSDALNVKDAGIGASQLATDAVTTVKILDSNVTNAKLANSSISFEDETATAGSVSLGGTLEFLAGEGISTTASGSTLTIAGELATNSNIGVASFSSDNFTVSSGDVTVTAIDGGSY